MNRQIFFAQILGALVFIVAATAIADPHQFVLQKDDVTATFKLSTVRVPGKIEYPNLVAKPGRQTVELNLEWTADLDRLTRLATRGIPLGKRTITLQVGDKWFSLKNCTITSVAFPDVCYNPKEISIDKCVGLKIDTDVQDYLEGGHTAQGRRRPFHGGFKGQVVGIETAVFQKVHAFEVPIVRGSRGAQNNKGSMKVELSEAAARAAQWTADRRKANPTAIYSQEIRLVQLDSVQRPLLTASMRLRNVKSLGFTSAEGRSMSFELFFESFELGAQSPEP